MTDQQRKIWQDRERAGHI